jgi:hypothetical protein
VNHQREALATGGFPERDICRPAGLRRTQTFPSGKSTFWAAARPWTSRTCHLTSTDCEWDRPRTSQSLPDYALGCGRVPPAPIAAVRPRGAFPGLKPWRAFHDDVVTASMSDGRLLDCARRCPRTKLAAATVVVFRVFEVRESWNRFRKSWVVSTAAARSRPRC